jgi:hypothetical protein
MARRREIRANPSGRDLRDIQLSAFSCPRCDTFDRDRLTALYLEQVFRNFDPGSPRAMQLHKKLKRHPFVAYRSADLSRKDVDELIDLTAMDRYAGISVDILLCSHVLEHIPDAQLTEDIRYRGERADRRPQGRRLLRNLRIGLALHLKPLIGGGRARRRRLSGSGSRLGRSARGRGRRW